MKTENKKQKSKIIEEPVRRTSFDFNDDKDFHELIEIVKKDKQFKTQSEIDILRLAFSSFKFFNDLEEQMGSEHVNTLYQELSYERMAPRSVVFHFGDLGRKFYIILRGTVWVLVKKKGLSDGKETNEPDDELAFKKKPVFFTKVQLRQSKSFLGSPLGKHFASPIKQDEIEEEDDRFMTDDQFVEKKFSTFVKVGSMTSGANFGEIALTKQVPRTATIICSEACHFVTLTRETFNRMLSEYYEQLQQQNIKFLQQLAVFSEWNEPMLNQLYYHFTFKNYKLNQLIYKENDPANEIYLIKEGEVELSKNVEILMRDATEAEKLIENFRGTAIGKFNCKYRRIKSAMLTVGQMFGQDEVLKKTKRKSMAVCTSDKLTVFILEKQRFFTYCTRGKTIEKVASFTDQKINWRVNGEETLIKIEKPPYSNIDPDQQQQLFNELIDKRMKSMHFSSQKNGSPDSNRRLSSFVIPKIQNVYERVSDKLNENSFALMQDKTHMNKVVGNFTSKFDGIKKCMKAETKVDLNSGFFNLDSKGSSISILNKVFPSALRSKYQIPQQFGRNSIHLIRSLKLPRILSEIELKTSKYDEVFERENVKNSFGNINQKDNLRQKLSEYTQSFSSSNKQYQVVE